MLSQTVREKDCTLAQHGAGTPERSYSGSQIHSRGLAGVYLGKVTKWNDQTIKGPNKGARLPDAEIVVFHRADGSGTTYAWSDSLSKVSTEWKASVGAGLTLNSLMC